MLIKNQKKYILSLASGELAQLARASALQAEGQGFESLILHFQTEGLLGFQFFFI